MDISGKTIAITGAGSGIGQALAIKLASLGGCVAISDRDEDSLIKTESLLSEYKVDISRHIVDVAQQDQVYRFAQNVVERHGKVDILINNAGVSVMETLEDISYDDFHWIFSINFWGVVYGTKAFLPFLKQRPEAYIVNISSIAGLAGMLMQGSYCATKFAVRGFTEALELELLGTNVKSCCVYPGGVKTNIVRNARLHKVPYTGQNEEVDQAQCADDFEKNLAITGPDEAASKIVAAINKNKSRLLIGLDAKLIGFIQRFVPFLYPILISFYAKRAASVSETTREGKSVKT